jgi:hypothetical protein
MTNVMRAGGGEGLAVAHAGQRVRAGHRNRRTGQQAAQMSEANFAPVGSGDRGVS